MQKMNEKEAIAILKTMYPKKCKMVDGRLKGGFDNHECKEGQAIDIAIQALEEIQQYRAIGTIEELRADKAQMMLKKYGSFSEMIDAVAAYSVIGTVEKCSEAVERMKPKKARKIQIPNTSWSKAQTRFECPSCSKYLNYRELSHCGLCGQKLLWEE